jgi:hypothetical protein
MAISNSVKLPQLERWDLVFIKWKDILGSTDTSWEQLSKIDWTEWETEMDHASVGFFLYKNKKIIAICQSMKMEKEHLDPGEENVSAVLCIPIPTIRDIKVVKRKKDT